METIHPLEVLWPSVFSKAASLRNAIEASGLLDNFWFSNLIKTQAPVVESCPRKVELRSVLEMGERSVNLPPKSGNSSLALARGDWLFVAIFVICRYFRFRPFAHYT